MVLANAGHHPAAGDGRWTLVQYKEAISEFIDAAIRKGYNESNLVWLESVPQPLRYIYIYVNAYIHILCKFMCMHIYVLNKYLHIHICTYIYMYVCICRNDKWFIGFKDWRSYHRLKQFNLEANLIVQRGYGQNTGHHGHEHRSSKSIQDKDIQQHSGFSVISAFTTTMPYIDKLCDNAHFGNEEILLPQYLGFLKALSRQRSTS
jgi:hypothetical protein